MATWKSPRGKRAAVLINEHYRSPYLGMWPQSLRFLPWAPACLNHQFPHACHSRTAWPPLLRSGTCQPFAIVPELMNLFTLESTLLPIFFIVPGWKDHLSPPSTLRAALRTVAITVAMGMVDWPRFQPSWSDVT